jgi:hypothetical protein
VHTLRPPLAAVGAVFALTLVCGCGSATAPRGDGDAAVALDLARTRQVGAGPAFRPSPYGAAVLAAAPVGRLRCRRGGTRPYGVHVELFALGRGVLVPAGIGVAPPQRRVRAIVAAGRCRYPLRTLEPTGVIEIDATAAGARPTLGELFAVWGQRLDARRLLGFRAARGGAVVAYLDGRRWRGDPRAIPLRRHAQIVLEMGPHVDPHPRYRFADGL